tara:strand:+ start:351 stop:734 length:384 start_codon:yes stop_codon:yes gene_type:complete
MDINTIQPQNPNLIEITTPVQSRRGNRQFFCQQHKVSYITYANGYVRREINASYDSPYTASQKAYKVQDQFVLNRRKSIPTQWGFSSRVVIKEHNAQARMDMIDRISSNYKGYTGRFTNLGHTLIMK